MEGKFGKSVVSRQKRSTVWSYFEEVGTKAKCKSCGREYVRQSGTTNLFNHLKSAHPKEHAAAVGHTGKAELSDSKTATSSSTKPINSFFSSSTQRTCSSARAGSITELLLDWIVDSTRPLSMVADPAFVRLLSFLEPEYKVPSRTHLASLLAKRHHRAKEEMKCILREQATAGVALTTDGWTSCATQSFVTHTVHFLNPEWVLRSGVLETVRFKGRHTAENLAAFSRDVTRRFELSTGLLEELPKVVAITHDEAANMVAAGKLLDETDGWESQACMAHQLQTTIRHALDSSTRIRVVLARCRRLVGHFKHSTTASEVLVDKQVALNKNRQPVTVVQDVSTRWNSTFYMVCRLQELRTPLTVVLSDASLTKKKDDRDLLLKDDDWNLVDDLVMILKEYEDATTVVGGESYLTLSLLLPITTHLYDTTARYARKAGTVAGKALAETLNVELTKKFPIHEPDMGSPAVISAALDPRFRHLQFLPEEQRDVCKRTILSKAMDLRQEQPTPEEAPKKQKELSKLSQLLGKRQHSDSESDESECDGKASHKRSTVSFETKLQTETMLYFTEDALDLESDPLHWWKANSYRYPHLAALARRYLCIPATSVSSERVFSAAGLLVSKLRASLSSSNIDAAVFLNKNSFLESARYQHAKPEQEEAEYRPQEISEEEQPYIMEPDDPMLPCLD